MDISFSGKNFSEPVRKGLAVLQRQKVVPRIFEKDWTVWRDGPAEIRNRLGWLTSPRRVERNLAEIQEFVRSVRTRGYTKALLLGMGGSSLAPLVLADVFQTARGYLDLEVLDSTDPASVLRRQQRLNPLNTL
ncbi:MAG: hypothetical protein AB1715_10970, partial [Acidobacteriota bacterium]